MFGPTTLKKTFLKNIDMLMRTQRLYQATNDAKTTGGYGHGMAHGYGKVGVLRRKRYENAQRHHNF
jgi:hypothetical protein